MRSRHRGVQEGDAGRVANDLKVGAEVEVRSSTRGARGARGTVEKERGSRKVWGRVSQGDVGVASGPQGEEGASAEEGGTRVGEHGGDWGRGGLRAEGTLWGRGPHRGDPGMGYKRGGSEQSGTEGAGKPPLTGPEMGTGEDRPEGTRGKGRAPR